MIETDGKQTIANAPKRSRPEVIRGHSVNTWYGVVFGLWKDEPIYHRVEIGSTPKGFKTLCGREVGVYRPLLPLKHLEKFAVLCKGCRE